VSAPSAQSHQQDRTQAGQQNRTQAGQELAALRRAIHRDPETGLHLPRTQRKILDALDGLGLPISVGRQLSSVTAVVRGERPGPAVVLRADMDALPGREETAEPFASTGDAGMHACGHDLHVAALVGAAKLLADRRPRLAGSVVLMFQPGEEGQGGARLMVEEGVLDAAGTPAVAAYGLHVLSAILPRGMVASRGGPMLSAADVVRVTVKGSGGHGSQPHLAKDPVVAACAMVTALQTLVTREFDVFDPVVLNVGVFNAGVQHNIVPGRASFEVSVRSFSAAARDRAIAGVKRTVDGIARAHGLEADTAHEELYPVTVTDPQETRFALDVARDMFGVDHVVELPHPASASEDFAFVLEQVPGAYLFLGACPPGTNPTTAPVNHSADAVFDDTVLPDAAALLAGLAERRLADAAGRAGTA
jgi:hippurate hydrolase